MDLLKAKKYNISMTDNGSSLNQYAVCLKNIENECNVTTNSYDDNNLKIDMFIPSELGLNIIPAFNGYLKRENGLIKLCGRAGYRSGFTVLLISFAIIGIIIIAFGINKVGINFRIVPYLGGGIFGAFLLFLMVHISKSNLTKIISAVDKANSIFFST